jgi:hypothetical protein
MVFNNSLQVNIRYSNAAKNFLLGGGGWELGPLLNPIAPIGQHVQHGSIVFPNGANLFRFLSSLPLVAPSTARQCLGPTCHLSILN